MHSFLLWHHTKYHVNVITFVSYYIQLGHEAPTSSTQESADVIPVSSQVKAMNDYIQQTIKQKKDSLEAAPSSKEYAVLSQAVLADLVMFNRRSGDIHKIQYEDIEKARIPGNEEILKGLSKWEQKLCAGLKRVEVRGKSRKNPRVPIIMTKKMAENVHLLISKREENGVKNENPYLFAIPGYDSTYRGSDALRKFSK